MTTLDDFPLQTFDKIRYGDTDRQGHVNNAVFTTFMETGRVQLIYDPSNPIVAEGGSFVIAKLVLEYKKEVTWPGEVQIGTRVAKVGTSSLTIEQALFQNGACVATSESIIVHFDAKAHKSKPLSEAALAWLRARVVPTEPAK